MSSTERFPPTHPAQREPFLSVGISRMRSKPITRRGIQNKTVAAEYQDAPVGLFMWRVRSRCRHRRRGFRAGGVAGKLRQVPGIFPTPRPAVASYTACTALPHVHKYSILNIRSSSRSACILFGTSGVQARTREKTGSKRTLVAQTHTCEVCFDAVALAGKADNRPCCGGEDMKRERVVGSKRGGSSARTPDAFDVRDHLHR